MTPKDVHIMTPRTCGYITWKKELPNIIKLRILRREDYPILPKWNNVTTKVLIKGR